MARAALKWGVRDVAREANVSPATVTRVEGDNAANPATLTVLQAALEAAGIEFLPDNGVKLRS
jgi:transcriptional regulator with XRE-family HTH domain